MPRIALPTLAAGLLLASASVARSAVTVDLAVTSGPSLDSPNLTDYGVNAYQSALQGGFSSVGTAGEPEYVNPKSAFTGRDFMESPDFTSWRGNAAPSGTTANEHGNRWYVLGSIRSDDGTQFRLQDLVGEVDSTDSFDWFDQSFDFNGISYDTGLKGRLPGDDGELYTGDDEIFDSGNGDTFVEAIDGVLFSNALLPDGTGTEQEQLNELLSAINNEAPFDVSTSIGVEKLNSLIAAETTTFEVSSNPVPTPTTGLMAGALLSFLTLKRRVRRS